jgi:peroxiredoxin
MAIEIGAALPEATFYTMTADGPAPRTTAEVFGGRTVALVGVPGAFTPTCHRNHLPGFIEHAAALKAKGIDAVAVTAVNDVFVMDAWARETGGAGIVEFLADGSGAFARAIGLDLDLVARGMGVRSQRYAMVVRDGVVTSLAVELPGGRVDLSSATAVLAALADDPAAKD